MPSIEIDKELYDYLLQNTEVIGEDASSIIGRLIDRVAVNSTPSQEAPSSAADELRDVLSVVLEAPERADPTEGAERIDPIAEFLRGRAFQICETAIDRFLTILSWAYSRDRDGFSRVTDIAGAERVYFSTSEVHIANSGHQTNPRKIPGSPYFVVSNNDTQKKQTMLRDVLSTLGYSAGDKNRLVNAVAGDT